MSLGYDYRMAIDGVDQAIIVAALDGNPASNKIRAIKALRNATGRDLRPAKEMVEQVIFDEWDSKPEPSSDPFATLESQGYLPKDKATGENIARELGRINAASDKVSGRVAGSYLRLLTAAAQASMSAGWTDAALAVCTVNSFYYPKVVEGVTTPDIVPDKSDAPEERKRKTLERNSRSNFARTAASTLVGWIKAGGDLSTLDPMTVTKSQLARETSERRRAATAAVPAGTPRTAKTATDLEHAANRAFHVLQRRLKRVRESNPAVARALAEKAVEILTTKFVTGVK